MLNVFTVKKVYCNVYNYVALSHCLTCCWRGGGGEALDCWLYKWNHVQFYTYNASIIIINRSQGAREKGAAKDRQHRKDSSAWIWTPFAVEPMLCLLFQREGKREKKARDGNNCVHVQVWML